MATDFANVRQLAGSHNLQARLFAQFGNRMWETIKKILQKQKGTCIIVEEGRPTYVVASFEDYEKIMDLRQPELPKIAGNVQEQELLEKINSEIASWKIAQAEQQAALSLESDGEEEVKIENLPL